MLHFKLECVKIILEGNKLVCEYTGSKRVDYLYNGNGILYGLIYNGNKYFYLRDHLANYKKNIFECNAWNTLEIIDRLSVFRYQKRERLDE